MELNNSQYQGIADCFPRQRGNAGMDSLSVLNAFLYAAENGVKWRRLPYSHGNRHTVYARTSRRAKSGVPDRIFVKLQQKQIPAVKPEVPAVDSTGVKVHPDGTGALKKRTAGHRNLLRRSQHRNSYGCRGRTDCDGFFTFGRRGA
jgi:transposase